LWVASVYNQGDSLDDSVVGDRAVLSGSFGTGAYSAERLQALQDPVHQQAEANAAAQALSDSGGGGGEGLGQRPSSRGNGKTGPGLKGVDWNFHWNTSNALTPARTPQGSRPGSPGRAAAAVASQETQRVAPESSHAAPDGDDPSFGPSAEPWAEPWGDSSVDDGDLSLDSWTLAAPLSAVALALHDQRAATGGSPSRAPTAAAAACHAANPTRGSDEGRRGSRTPGAPGAGGRRRTVSPGGVTGSAQALGPSQHAIVAVEGTPLLCTLAPEEFRDDDSVSGPLSDRWGEGKRGGGIWLQFAEQKCEHVYLCVPLFPACLLCLTH
jgi:hypothetical protein